MVEKITAKFINKPLAKELLNKSKDFLDTIKEKGSKKVETTAPKFNIDNVDLGTKEPIKNVTVNPQNIQDQKINVSEEDAKKFIDRIYDVKNSGVKQAILKDFNINNIDTKDDILKIIDEISNKYSKEFDVRKGGVQTKKATQELADILNLDQATLTQNILKLKPGSTANAATVTAMRDLLVGANIKLDNLAIAARNGTPAELLEFRQHMALTAELQKIFKGVQTETARSLNAFKYTTRDKQFTNLTLDELNKINLLTELGGEEQVRTLANLYSGLNPREKINFSQKAGLIKKFGDYAQKGSDSIAEVFINSILSHPASHAKNIAGNWIAQGINQYERKLAGTGAKMGTEGVAPYEDVAKAFGKSQALNDMWQATVTAIKEGRFPNIASEIGGNKFETRPGAFTATNFGMKEGYLANAVDITGKILTLDRIPTKLLSASDAIFKNFEYRGELWAGAYRDTLYLISKGALSEDKAPQYLSRLVDNPTPEMTKTAYDAALYTTFQQKLGTRGDFLDVGKYVIDAKKQEYVKGIDWIFNVAIPFVQTPANILGFSLERTPGLNLLLSKYREDLAAGGARGDLALAKMEFGLQFYAVIATTGYFGFTSGTDQDLSRTGKSQKQATYGYQPKSVRIPYTDKDGVEKIFQLSFNGLDPAAQLLGMASDLGAQFRTITDDQNEDYLRHLAAFALFAGENLVNTPFLQNTADIFDNVQNIQKALSDGELDTKTISKMWKGTAAAFVPSGLKAVGGLYNDQVDKEAEFQKIAYELGDYYKRSFDERSLYSKYDLLGDPINKFQRYSTLIKDPIREELKKLDPNVDPIPTSKSVSFGAFNVSVPYDAREQSFIQQKAGQLTKEKLGMLFNDPIYLNETDDYVRKAYVQKNIASSRSEAEAFMLENDQEIADSIMIRAGELANSKAMKENNGQPLNLVPSTLIDQ
jgi:hypothetical protein